MTRPGAALLVALLALTGCGGGKSATPAATRAPTPSVSTSSTPTPAPTPTQAAPEVGDCYRLTYAEATRPTSPKPKVPCSGPHSAVTVYVGTINTVDDGHLLAVDSAHVQDQLASTCPTTYPRWIGGDENAQRLSRFSAVWFSPTVADADAGARWFRCDLVAVASPGHLTRLQGTVKDALADPKALDAYGTCGTAAPSEKSFRRLICGEPHTWQAVSVLPIPADANYLGKNVQADADAACKDEAAQRATDPLAYTWSFEWPSRKDWDAGQRYGLCWVPSS